MSTSTSTLLKRNKKMDYKSRIPGPIAELLSNRQLYWMAIPGIIWFGIFSYYPLLWLQIAFKDYNIQDGAFGSPFLEDIFQNFEFYFTSMYFVRTTFNTLFLNALSILSVLVVAMGTALLLNELKNKLDKKIFQSALFLPYFLSTIIVASFVYTLLGEQFGTVNSMLNSMGLEPVAWYSIPQLWPLILTVVVVWQTAGYYTVIYLATISSIDSQLYEAAKIDGASRWKEIRHITIPHLMPTVWVLLLLSIGRIFAGNFQLIFSIVGTNGLLFPTTDVIDTYVFRGLTINGTYGESTAIGLYQSVMGFIVVLIVNKLAKRCDESYGLF